MTYKNFFVWLMISTLFSFNQEEGGILVNKMSEFNEAVSFLKPVENTNLEVLETFNLGDILVLENVELVTDIEGLEMSYTSKSIVNSLEHKISNVTYK